MNKDNKVEQVPAWVNSLPSSSPERKRSKLVPPTNASSPLHRGLAASTSPLHSRPSKMAPFASSSPPPRVPSWLAAVPTTEVTPQAQPLVSTQPLSSSSAKPNVPSRPAPTPPLTQQQQLKQIERSSPARASSSRQPQGRHGESPSSAAFALRPPPSPAGSSSTTMSLTAERSRVGRALKKLSALVSSGALSREDRSRLKVHVLDENDAVLNMLEMIPLEASSAEVQQVIRSFRQVTL